MVTNELPGGNIRVISRTGKETMLDVELRGSRRDWFYWKFKAVFPESGRYTFTFVSDWKIGTRGPAVSHDRGRTWHWSSREPYSHTQTFTYDCGTAGEEVWFCQCIPYMQSELERFLAEYGGCPSLKRGILCRSRHGRPVEVLEIGDNPGAPIILLTARHHAQEAMASYVMEGMWRTALRDDDAFARDFRTRFRLYSVPFADKDGVEEGDQGKGRAPFDHARDYKGESIYPEVHSLRRFIDTEHPVLVMDIHCPWIRGHNNEEAYLVGEKYAWYDAVMKQFGDILERESPACAPYQCRNNVPYGTAWNTDANYQDGMAIVDYALAQTPHCHGFSLEVPFANFGETSIEPPAMYDFGRALLKTIRKFLA